MIFTHYRLIRREIWENWQAVVGTVTSTYVCHEVSVIWVLWIICWPALSLGYFVHLKGKLHPLTVPSPLTEARKVPFLSPCLLLFWRGNFRFFSPFSFFPLSVSVPLFYSIAFLLSQCLLNKPSITKIFLHGISVCSLPTTMPHPPWDPPRVISIINHNNELQSIYLFQTAEDRKKLKWRKDGSLLIITTVYWFRTLSNDSGVESDQGSDISLNSPAVTSASLLWS